MNREELSWIRKNVINADSVDLVDSHASRAATNNPKAIAIEEFSRGEQNAEFVEKMEPLLSWKWPI